MASKCRFLFIVSLIFAFCGVANAQSLTAEQVQQLPPSRGDAEYGYSVSVDGDTAVIGAFRLGDAGAAFVFVRTDGVWIQQAFLRSPSPGSSPTTGFGYSVSLDGDTALIGAPFDYRTGSWEPSAYVFVRTGGVWTQQARLRPGDGLHEDSNFGWSVALDGDTALIGANADDDNGFVAGSAYVFVRTGGVWTQQAKLLADDGSEGDSFGYSVSLDGDTALIGTPFDDNGPGLYGSNFGSAYIFMRSRQGWRQGTKLLADDGSREDRFGVSVSLDGGTALIGTIGPWWEDNSGSAYVFARSGQRWAQQAKLRADDEAQAGIGLSVSLDGDTALIGAPFDYNGLIPKNRGSAFVFVRTNRVWTHQATVLADDGMDHDWFGFSVSLDGDTVVIGAPVANDDISGKVYVFRLAPSGPGVLVITQADANALISPAPKIINLAAEE